MDLPIDSMVIFNRYVNVYQAGYFWNVKQEGLSLRKSIIHKNIDVHEDPRTSIPIILVGGIPTPLKHMKVSWGYYSQHMEK